MSVGEMRLGEDKVLHVTGGEAWVEGVREPAGSLEDRVRFLEQRLESVSECLLVHELRLSVMRGELVRDA